jgi:acetyl esterase/lipase
MRRTAIAAVAIAVLLALPAAAQVPAGAAATGTQWGALKTWTGVSTTYPVYYRKFVYGAAPFLITDTRSDDLHADKQSYETRGLTVYRAEVGGALAESRPVIFFVHGGAWTDGYENWYDFVAQSFTGQKGWTTVVIDYRLAANEVFLADQWCPDRTTCAQPLSVANRTKAAWCPDNREDVAAALAWTIANIAGHGGDPARIVVFGHSAGGHLASLVASHPAHAALRPSIRAVISMSGAYSLTEMNKAFWANSFNQVFTGGVMDDAALAEASAATYAVPGATLPPFYLLYCEDELLNLTSQAIAFQGQLASLGSPVSISYLPGYSHEGEMTAIADAGALPTSLIIAYVENLLSLRHSLYLPLVRREG